MTYIPEIEDDINDFCTISDMCNEYINGEGYRNDYNSDDVTKTDLLYELYDITLTELKKLGIFFHIDIEDLVSNRYNAKILYHLRKHFDTEKIVEYIKVPAFKNKLESLLQDRETEEDLVTDIIEVMLNIFYEDKSIRPLENALDKVYSTLELNKHLLAILDLMPIRMTVDPDPKNLKIFIEYLMDHRRKIEQGFKLATELDATINLDEVKHRISIHDLDKTAADKVHIHSYMYVEGEDNINPSIKQFTDEIDDRHHKSNRHHIEYWVERPNDRMENIDLAELVIDMYAKSKTVGEFKERHAKTILAYNFNPAQLEYMQMLGDAILEKVFSKDEPNLLPNGGE